MLVLFKSTYCRGVGKTRRDFRFVDKALDCENTAFIDLSTWVKKDPSGGHLFSFHSEILKSASVSFNPAFILGTREEASETILPIFRRNYFHRGLGALIQKFGMREDLEKASLTLDSIAGNKLIHVYEGGFRELTFLSEILASRTDCSAVFNFFNAEPWSALFSRANPLSGVATRILRQAVEQMQGKVVFTVDTDRFAIKMAGTVGRKKLNVYPLFSNLKANQQLETSWKSRPVTFMFTPRTYWEKRLVLQTLKVLEQSIQEIIDVVIASRWTSVFRSSSLKRLELKKIRVRVQSGPSSEEHYSKLFFDSKVVVLPYLDKHYVYGSSGKLFDARAGGCWVVAPNGTSAGDSVDLNGWGKTFNGRADDLAKTLASLNLDQQPKADQKSNGAHRTIDALSGLVGLLPAGAPQTKRIPWLYTLPFLLGFSGFYWLALHLILVPSKRFLMSLIRLPSSIRSGSRLREGQLPSS